MKIEETPAQQPKRVFLQQGDRMKNKLWNSQFSILVKTMPHLDY